MKQKKYEFCLMQGLVTCVAIIILARMLNLSAVSSAVFYMMFPLTVALWLVSMRRGVSKLDYMAVATVVLAAICVIVDLWRSQGTLTGGYAKKVAMFATTLIFLCAANRCRLDDKLVEYTQVLIDMLTVMMGVMLMLSHDRMHMIGGKVSRYITLGFSNPNSLSLFVTCMYMLTFCTLCKKQSHKVRNFHIAVLTAQIFILLGTHCRTGQMVTMLFTAMAFCVLYRKKIKSLVGITVPLKIHRWVAVSLALFPMVFAMIYMSVVGAEWVEKLFSFMISEGKGIDSRVEQWTPAFEAIVASPLIGAYYAISGGTGSSQLHNTHADTAASYGVPVMLLMSAILAICMYQRGKKYRSPIRFMYMLAFCCAMLMGTFEAAVFSGGLGIYVFTIIFLAFSKCEEAKDDDLGWNWILSRTHKGFAWLRQRRKK